MPSTPPEGATAPRPAVRGAVGEALARFDPDSFDVVLTDYAMPEMRGDQLAAAVKRVNPDTPVVLVTGYGALMASAGEQPDGVDAVLAKPISQSRLRETLRDVTAHRAAGIGSVAALF